MRKLCSIVFSFVLLFSAFAVSDFQPVDAQTSTGAPYRIYLPLILDNEGLPLAVESASSMALVWSDEFNGPSLDLTNWKYEIGGGGWGNQELEYYTDRPQNSWIQNGNLVIQAQPENYNGYSYTSARIDTKGLRQFQYGYIEAKIKLAYGQGVWPTFWMMGVNGTWPQCGENDIVEYTGKIPDKVDEALHGPSTIAKSFEIGTFTSLGTTSIENDYHTYGLWWQKDDIRWYIDGKQVLEETPSTIPSGGEWVWNNPAYMILNVAVGGTWPGSPDSTTVWPQQMWVDYVRVYQKP